MLVANAQNEHDLVYHQQTHMDSGEVRSWRKARFPSTRRWTFNAFSRVPFPSYEWASSFAAGADLRVSRRCERLGQVVSCNPACSGWSLGNVSCDGLDRPGVVELEIEVISEDPRNLTENEPIRRDELSLRLPVIRRAENGCYESVDTWALLAEPTAS